MRIHKPEFLSRLLHADGSGADDHNQPSLRDDQSGAVMVIGLFMAVFLAGMMYYIIGLGDAIAYRERMQDTSDVGSFTAAVVSARGMNLIVLLNMIMAAIMAIMLSLKVIEVVVTVAMGIAAAVGALCFGCTAPAVAFLNTVRQTVSSIADAFEPIAQGIITACNLGQTAIKTGWPIIGRGRAVYNMVGDNSVSQSPATAGLIFPVYASLPVEDHIFRETCDRGAQIAVNLIASPFESIPIIGGRVSSWIRSSAGRIYASYSAYFCGGEAPELEPFRIDRARPATPNLKACETQCNPVEGICPAACSDPSSDACGAFLNTACHEATQESATLGSGYCPPTQINRNATTIEGDEWCNTNVRRWQGCYDDDRGTDASPVHRGDQIPGDTLGRLRQGDRVPQAAIRSGCIARVQDATEQCAAGGRDIRWSMESRYVVYFKTSLPTAPPEDCEWDARVVDPGDLTDELRNWRGFGPNRRHQVCPQGIQWNAGGGEGPRPFASSCPPLPMQAWKQTFPARALLAYPDSAFRNSQMCNALPESFDAAVADLGENPFHRRVDVRLVDSCIVEEELDIDIDYDDFGSSALQNPDEWKPPQRICELTGSGGFFETGCAESGEPIFHGAEEFQLRAAVRGRELSSSADEGTRVATWSGPNQRGIRGVSIPDPRAHIGTWSASHLLAQSSMSQSEFFWDQRESCNNDSSHCEGYVNLHNDEREWMWDMAWAARMRRIHFTDPAAAEDSANSGSDDQGVLGGVSGWFDKAFLH